MSAEMVRRRKHKHEIEGFVLRRDVIATAGKAVADLDLEYSFPLGQRSHGGRACIRRDDLLDVGEPASEQARHPALTTAEFEHALGRAEDLAVPLELFEHDPRLGHLVREGIQRTRSWRLRLRGRPEVDLQTFPTFLFDGHGPPKPWRWCTSSSMGEECADHRFTRFPTTWRNHLRKERPLMVLAPMLRKVLRAAPFAAAQRLVPEHTMNHVRRKLFPMTAREATRVLAGLVAAGAPFVLAGGWGVDALVSELKRKHSDLDIITTPSDLPMLAPALADLGYARTPEVCEGGWWAPETTTFRSVSGGRIEVLVLTTEHLELLAQRAEQMLGHSVDRAPVRGRVGDTEVACLSAELQLAAHDGFAMNRAQRGDFYVIEALVRG